MTIGSRWAKMTLYARDAWVAKDLFGWSVTKEPVDSTGRYWGNSLGRLNKIGGLAGVDIEPVPLYTEDSSINWLAKLVAKEMKRRQAEEEGWTFLSSKRGVYPIIVWTLPIEGGNGNEA